jgi:tRNA (guanine10-N2)-dimethyltransferase
MRFGFLLLGDLSDFGYFEVRNLLDSFTTSEEVMRDGRILILDTREEPGEGFFKRLAMVRETFNHHASVDLSEVEKAVNELDIRGKRVCVRVKKLRDSSKKFEFKSTDLEKKLGEILWRKGNRIDLRNPEMVVKVYVSSLCHVGILNSITETKQFLERRPDKKPFFKPGALLPRFARSLINITGIKEGAILDPMCGTGTVLVEAGLMGLKFVGVEGYRWIAEGCMRNLRYYNLPSNIMLGDARNLPFQDSSFNAVVTDYPYLRSSKSIGKIEELYENSLAEISRILRGGRRAVLVTNINLERFEEIKNFQIENVLLQRVHKNLERKIYIVLNKKTG